VRRLRKIEICGTGDGDSWVGYRQRLGHNLRNRCFSVGHDYVHYIPTNCFGGPSEDVQPTGRFFQLGSTDVLPAVRTIEALVHSHQLPDPFFCIHVNGCEDCHLYFAQYLPHYGKDSYDGNTTWSRRHTTHFDKGRHTCMLYGEGRFICLECLRTRYHCCAEEECLTCVCIDCDGKPSVTACHSSGTDLEWERLEEEGTTHFDLVSCYREGHNDSCRFPQQLKQLCKDAEMCCGPSLGPDCCKECGGWQCRWCDTDWSRSRCAKCNARECILDNCHFVIYRCDACDETYCSDTCSQICMFKVLNCDDSDECELCPECYLEYSDDASMTLAFVGTYDGEEEEDEEEEDGEVEAEYVEAEEEQAH